MQKRLSVNPKKLCVKLIKSLLTGYNGRCGGPTSRFECCDPSPCKDSACVAHTRGKHVTRVHSAHTKAKKKKKKEKLSRAVGGSGFCGPSSSLTEFEPCNLSFP